MNVFAHAFMMTICLLLLWPAAERWQQLHEAVYEGMRVDYAIQYCGRLAALEANFAAASSYLDGQLPAQSWQKLGELFRMEVDNWRQRAVEMSLNCSQYRDQFVLYQQFHAGLPARYPNVGMRLRAP